MDYDYLKYKKILIVDDEGGLLEMVTSILEQDGFKEIKTAGTVSEALSVCKEWNPEIAVLDVMLPDGNGFSLFEQMRVLTDIPVLFLTARGEDEDKLKGLGLGADDYITKPFSPSELVARVKAHLARYERLIGSNTVENDVIEIRGIRIDKTARRVWVNGEEKQFTTKEFDLLTFLAEHPNHVFTKEELFREIWDMESIGDIATVTVHIKKIREKIEMNTNKPQYIETIWGVGYRFKL